MSSERRVVVSGIGMVTALGLDAAETWRALLAGESGIRPIDTIEVLDLPSRIAGNVVGFEPARYLDHRELRRTDRYAQLAIAAATEAVMDAGLVAPLGDDVGVIIGSSKGGIATLEAEIVALELRGASKVSPLTMPRFNLDVAAANVAMQLGAGGPNFNPVSACASGADAIGLAADAIRRGAATTMT